MVGGLVRLPGLLEKCSLCGGPLLCLPADGLSLCLGCGEPFAHLVFWCMCCQEAFEGVSDG